MLRFPLAAALCLALAASAVAEAPLSRLASALAEEIARAARGRPVEMGGLEDRTGRGAGFVLDLCALVRSRLGDQAVPAATERPHLRVEGVLTEVPLRLVVSARLVSMPEGTLVDMISVSVPTDPAVLPFTPTRPAGTGASGFEVAGSSRTPPLEAPVLALAPIGNDRLLVLHPDAVALYRWEDSGLRREARRELPGPLERVRRPGGLLLVTEGGDVWALTSCSPRTSLFALEDGGRRLAERLVADALPWPGSPAGLRFRPGTNLLEGAVEGVGSGPFLAVVAPPAAAVAEDGRLLLSTPEGPRPAGIRTGPVLGVLGRDALLAASAAPPDKEDAILILPRGDRELGPGDRLSVPGGAVRALTARVRGDKMQLLAALEEAGGVTYLLALDLRRTAP